MSTTKFSGSFVFLVIIFCYALISSVDGIPTSRKPLISTKLQPPKNQTGRNARFFGKVSVLAGLGLPDPATLPIDRNDIVYEQRVPQFQASYNFPPARWGPYVAAVYEPLPILTWLQNSLAYLARLNPFNWFGNGAGLVTSTSSRPDTLTETTDKNPDNIVVLVDEPSNEMSHLERDANKVETSVEHDIFNADKYVMNAQTPGSVTTTVKDDVTFANVFDKYLDLIAEETTIKLLQDMKMDRNFEDDSRQAGFAQGTDNTETVPGVTTGLPGTTIISTTPTANVTNQQPQIPTSTNATITSDNSTITTVATDNSASNATRPQPSLPTPTFYPGSVQGYYYGGYPQNVSHVHFTTTVAPNPVVPPARFQNVNNFNAVPQQYPINYYDTNEVQPQQGSFDYYSRLDNFAPEIHDYNNKNDLSPSGGNHFQSSGFKPSFPYYL